MELASEDSEPIGGQKGDLDVLRSLFVMAGETMATENVLTSEFSDLQHGDNTLLHSGLDEEQVFLPVSPIELARWLESLDRALARR